MNHSGIPERYNDHPALSDAPFSSAFVEILAQIGMTPKTEPGSS
jgi:hypothetical protein